MFLYDRITLEYQSKHDLRTEANSVHTQCSQRKGSSSNKY